MPNGRRIVNRAAELFAESTTAVTLTPRPFLLSGSDGGRSRACILPPGAMVFATPPARRLAGRSRRDAYRKPRPRKLSSVQEAAIRTLGPSRSLRSLAADFGVSHETIRAVLREREGRPVGAAA